MLNFRITVSDKYKDGFKLSVKADDKDSQRIAEELTKLLIDKIEKLTIEVKSQPDY